MIFFQEYFDSYIQSVEFPCTAFTGYKYFALIGLYTAINYLGRYATCSHKDGGRSVFNLGKDWPGGPRDMLKTTSVNVNLSPAFLSHLQDAYFL